MGVVTGVFQYANGSPVANAPYQWKLSGDAIEFSGTSACICPPIVSGFTDSNGNLTTTFAFNDVLSTTAGATTYYQFTLKAQNGGQVWNELYYLTGTAANLNLIPPGGNPFITTIVSGGLPTGQIGDIIRFNVNADSNWDAVNYTQPTIGLYANANTPGNAQAVGAFGSGAANYTNNNASVVNPTATSGAGISVGRTAVASTNTVIGLSWGENGSTSSIGMQAFYRWSFKAAISNLTNVRYWMGLACFHSGGAGNNGAANVGTTAYATDTPNKSTEGFRFSAGTDTNWQAVAITAGGSQTTVDTGIAADTAIHLFEMTTNAAGTAILYWIDRVLVATISTNLPPPANAADSWGSLFFTGDNKNTSTAFALVFYTMQISLK